MSIVSSVKFILDSAKNSTRIFLFQISLLLVFQEFIIFKVRTRFFHNHLTEDGMLAGMSIE